MPADGFIEITPAQRNSLAFRPYRAFFGWQYSSADHDFRGDGKGYRPGHRLPNGNYRQAGVLPMTQHDSL